MKLMIYVLALMSLALLGGASADGEIEEMLEKLCLRKRDAPEVTHISQVRAMASLVNDKSYKGRCPKSAAKAIEKLVELTYLRNVCSQAGLDEIVAFWKVYGVGDSEQKKDLPKPLRKFFAAFALQVSKLCKETMVSRLEKATEENKITDEDFQIVSQPVLVNVEKIFDDSRIDNLLAIVKATRHHKASRKSVKVDSQKMKYYNLQRKLCVHKFQPIYDSLIVPIVRLAAIGYNYGGKTLAEQVKQFEKSQLYRNWFAAVIACEATAMIYPTVVKTKKGDEAKGKDEDKSITVLEQDDIEMLKKAGLTLEEPAPEVPLVDYKVERVQLGDLILDKSDSYIVKALSKQRLHLSSVSKFRLRMLKNLPSIMKVFLEKTAINVGLIPSGADAVLLHETKLVAPKTGSKHKKFWGWLMILGGGAVLGGLAAAMIAAATLTGGPIPFLVIAFGCVIALSVIRWVIANSVVMFNVGRLYGTGVDYQHV